MITKTNTAEQLPDEWNTLVKDYFQNKEFLIYTEKFNPCKQRYYVLEEEGGTVIAGCIVYTLKMDLLTFLNIKSPVKINIIGIPCSVLASGFIGDEKRYKDLSEYVFKQEKGLIVSLNLKNPYISDKTVSGKTLPTIIVNNRFSTYREYQSNLRSSYRRRYKLVNDCFKDISEDKISCSSFTEDMYRLYLEVLKRSKGRL